MSRILPSLLTLLITAAFAPLLEGSASGQDQAEVTIKLKIFDSDNPKTELVPRAAFIFVRNQANNQPELLTGKGIEPIPEEKGFYRARVPKGRLIEELVIEVSSSSGTNYNPAVVSKVVTAADMVLYPGASDPGSKFSFFAYTGQLNTYKTIITQLVDEFGEAQGRTIRDQLRKAFGKQLLEMADAEVRGRLSNFTQEQLATARKLADEVLKLYGLREQEYPTQPPVIIYPCYQVYPVFPVQPCYPSFQPTPIIRGSWWCR